ncbi:MAG: tetratricopeptide repeat protein [Alphaproteobacteria bacterium]
MKRRARLALLASTTAAALFALHGATALAHDTGAPHGQGAPLTQASYGDPAAEVPLFDTLGSHSYAITTDPPLAQAYFNQGLRWTWAFNHGEALRAFRAAQQIDPGCAMCYWGEAFALGPNINAGMAPDAMPQAVAAIVRAQELMAGATLAEQGLITALATRYSDDPAADQAALGAAYEAAMATLAARFPDDDEIATLHADAIMNLSPWDYWLDGGATPKPATVTLVGTLETVLARNPDHPGAIHLYIHAVEASTEPERAEPHADRLAALMPGAGHLVHMPAHIYFRVGRWLDSLETNRMAVAADEAYFAAVDLDPRTLPGVYTDGYYPHNVHFLLTSAQMAGDVATIAEAAAKLESLVSVATAREVAWLQPIKAAGYYAHAQYSAADVILALPEPDATLPYVVSTWHYARGVALAAAGDLGAASAEAEAIRAIGAGTDFSAAEAGGLPATALIELSALIVDARIAQAEGDLATARERLETAVAIQDTLAYMEPAFWYYPVEQTLGAVLMAMGETEAAEATFRAALADVPNNGWVLWGLRELYRSTGDTTRAEEMNGYFRAAWAGDPEFLTLERL